jgi:hypothetical protein
MIPSEKGEAGRLGILGRRYPIPCVGNLEVTYNPVDEKKCALQADIEMKNCEGRWYVLKVASVGALSSAMVK